METEAQRLKEKTTRRAAILETKRKRAEELKDEGKKHFRQQRFVEAATSYEQAIMTYGPRVVYMNNLAAAYLKLERYDDAETCAEQALTRDHTLHKARYRRALARKGLGKLRSAAADLAIVMAQDPACAEAGRELNAVSDMLDNIGDEAYDADDARETMDELSMPLPDDPYLDGAEDTPWLSETSDFEHAGNAVSSRFYNHDGCKKGRNCPFSHAPDNQSVRDNLGRNVCLFHMLGLCKFPAADCVYTHDTHELPHGPWAEPTWGARNRRMLEPSGVEHSAQVLEQLAPLLKPTQPVTRESLLPTTRLRELKEAGTAYMTSFMKNVPAAMVPGLAEIYRGAPGRVRRGEVPGTSRRGKAKAEGKGSGRGKDKGTGKGKGKSQRAGSSKDYSDHWGESEIDEEMEERAANMGFTNDEVHELLSQGVKPWDDDAWDVMDVLRSS